MLHEAFERTLDCSYAPLELRIETLEVECTYGASFSSDFPILIRLDNSPAGMYSVSHWLLTC